MTWAQQPGVIRQSLVITPAVLVIRVNVSIVVEVQIDRGELLELDPSTTENPRHGG